MSQKRLEIIPVLFTALKSAPILLDTNELVGIEVPAAFVGATIGIEGRYVDGGTFFPVYIYNKVATPVAATITHTTLTGREYLLDPLTFAGLHEVRFSTDSATDNGTSILVSIKRIF